MPDAPQSGSNFYALLIGIDHYLPNRLYKSLKGAVRDINLVADYFTKTLKLPSEHLFKLVSANPEPASANVPTQPPIDPSTLPTYANIVAKFQAITELAQPGDQVYIHYSGHGGRALTVYPDLKGAAEYDEGIVPMDGGAEGRYLRDLEMTTLLKRMTDKGLLVTMVLDSCHSGGATRGDCEIRGGEMADETVYSLDSLVAAQEELIRNWQLVAEGGPTGLLTQNRDYVMLAACRPTEYAYEYAVSGKERHGALTYWMIDTLANSKAGLTYNALYDRVVAKIQSKFPQQLPMLSGQANRIVFGSDLVSLQYAITVMKVDLSQQVVSLGAGLSQGLSQGSRFAIYPLGTTDFYNPQLRLAIVEITSIGSASGSARILPVAEGGIAASSTSIEPGCQAVMVTAPVDLVRRVRLFDQKQAGDQEQNLPPELVSQQSQALQLVRDALADNGWVVELKDNERKDNERKEGQEAHYQVAVGRGGEYEICIGMPIENLRPPLPIADPTSAVGVMQRLVHLAKYQAVQELDNPNSKLTAALEVELMTQPDWQPGTRITAQPFPDSSNITVKAGEITFLRIRNNFSQSLNVAVLDIEPTWAISQIPLLGLDAPFYELAPEEEIFTPLQFQVPAVEGYEVANETLKVFATLLPSDYRWLLLPALDQEISRKGNEVKRSSSALGNLLAAIGGDVDQAPSLSRAAVYVADPNQEWTTKQVRLEIVR